MSLNQSKRVKVLIIGAGPIGCTAALQLSKTKQSIRIIDMNDDVCLMEHSKATVVHPRPLELLPEIADILVEKGLKLTGTTINRVQGAVEVESVHHLVEATEFPFSLGIQQGTVERELLKKLCETGILVERKTKFKSLEQNDDGVSVVVEKSENGLMHLETIYCDYVIGCDGAHSLTRKLVKAEFKGDRFDETFNILDCRMSSDISRSKVHLFLRPEYMMLLYPLPNDANDLWRFMTHNFDIDFNNNGKAPQAVDHGRNKHKSVDVNLIQSQIDEMLSGPILHDVQWNSVFHISKRCVEELKFNRIFLAGDAAHIHSPVGSQGLNTGIGDISNLTWKLGMVINGQAPPSILESYSTERVPIIKDMLQSTTTSMQAVTTGNLMLQSMRNKLMGYFLGFEFVQSIVAHQMAELHVTYKGSKSPILDNYLKGDSAIISAGSRAPNAFMMSLNMRLYGYIRKLRQPQPFMHTAFIIINSDKDTLFDIAERFALQLIVKSCQMMNVVFVMPLGLKQRHLAYMRKINADVGNTYPYVMHNYDEFERAYKLSSNGRTSIVVIRPDMYVGYLSNDLHEEHCLKWHSAVFK